MDGAQKRVWEDLSVGERQEAVQRVLQRFMRRLAAKMGDQGSVVVSAGVARTSVARNELPLTHSALPCCSLPIVLAICSTPIAPLCLAALAITSRCTALRRASPGRLLRHGNLQPLRRGPKILRPRETLPLPSSHRPRTRPRLHNALCYPINRPPATHDDPSRRRRRTKRPRARRIRGRNPGPHPASQIRPSPRRRIHLGRKDISPSIRHDRYRSRRAACVEVAAPLGLVRRSGSLPLAHLRERAHRCDIQAVQKDHKGKDVEQPNYPGPSHLSL